MLPKISFIDLKRQQEKIRYNIEKRIKNVLDHGQYILGTEVNELETLLAQFVGVKHCITVANGTDALLIALLALGIKPGDEVITSPFTFIANAEMITLLGAKPVFVDIEENTYNINPLLIEQKITSKTKAIMPINLYGQCANFSKINEIAKNYNISVIEDGAQSFGASHFDKRSCGLSKIGCTSFFPSKPLGCYGDGGACFTDDDELAEIMKSIRVHGQKNRYQHVRVGLNGRLDTLQAAILLAKMNIFEDEMNRRLKLAAKYNQSLKNYFKVPFVEEFNTSVFAQYTIRVKQRKKFIESLNKSCIPTAIHYPTPAHLQPVYRSLDYEENLIMPISELVANEVVSLPFHPYLNEDEFNYIVDVVIKNSHFN